MEIKKQYGVAVRLDEHENDLIKRWQGIAEEKASKEAIIKALIRASEKLLDKGFY